MAPSLVGCQALPCVDAAGCCLAGPGHEVAACRTLGGPKASAGWVVRVRFMKTRGLLPTHWQVKPDSGDKWAVRAGSWSLGAGPLDPRAHIRFGVRR